MRAGIALLLAVAGIGFAAPPQRRGGAAGASRLASAHVLRTPPPGINTVRSHAETEAEFLTTDPVVCYVVILNGGHIGDKIRMEWRNPMGAVVQQAQHIQAVDGGPIRLSWRLLIAGNPAASTPGNWQVSLSINDEVAGSNDFRISTPPDSIVSIGSKTLLPAATVGVAYYFQLVAHGGKPPYQWTAVKPLPPGMTLSAAGEIAGAPQERGSYRAIVQAKDSAGNSVVRTFGIGIGLMAPAARSNTHILFQSAPANGCSGDGSQTDFPASAPAVVLAASLEAPGGREGRIEWLNPRGDIYQLNHLNKASERRECVVQTMPLAGHRAATEPGDWRVRLMWTDLEVFTLKFTISPAKAPAAGVTTGSAVPSAAPARSGRFAILIDNLRYDKLPAGTPATADLSVLERALRQDGFEVVRKSDVNLDNLRLIEHTLDQSLQAGDTALIYYSGYDIRAGGDDWLLPVSYDPGDARPIQAKAYSALRLMQVLEDSKAALKFIFLDAAAAAGQPRENPGAVMGEVDESTALIYSAPPGAAKGASPAAGTFARALAEVLGKPGLDARTVLQVELPKTLTRMAPSSPAPVAIMGGGADFVFHAGAIGGSRK